MRNKQLASLIIAGGLSIAGLIYGPKAYEKINNKSKEKSETILESKTKTYSTGDLEGRIFGDLYSDYTGIEGKVPSKAVINFEDELHEMWEEKLKKYPNKVASEFFENKVKDYNVLKSKKINLEKYISEAQFSIDEIKKTIDWNKVAKLKKLNKSELSLLKKVALSLNGKDLISYALTEIMPSSEGELNKDVLDFLLKNAGREYVEMIPAMHDPMTSFGPYQFTSYAVYNVLGDKDGASIVNEALPEKSKIPGSVSLLEENDHHKTAYLFALNNCANLINNLNVSQKRTFENLGVDKKADLVEYIATAHHLPKHAQDAYKKYLNNKTKTEYKTSCGKVLKAYANKTKANFNAIYKN